MEKGQCVDKYIYCNAYEGKDKETCESIIRYQDKETSLKYIHKCVLENNNWVMKEKKCEEAITYDECKLIKAPTNKKCIYLNEEWKEQYKDCESYNNNGKEPIEQNICESIVLDYLSLDSGIPSYQTNKCVFKQGTSNKCEKQEKKCSDFKIDDYIGICYDMSLSTFNKKCVYANNACSEINKSCLELYIEPSVTEEICESAPTSDDNSKVCKIRSDGLGCEEIEKEIKENKDNKSKFGYRKGKLIMNLLIIIWLLL